MADRQFEDPRTAALYDALCGRDGRADFAFYLPYLSGARRVLDVGCGTGVLLHAARARGHTGRLVGLDPAAAMLAVAAARERDVEWVRGDLATVSFDHEFDLVVMTGHAFQVLVTDDELAAALDAVARALVPGGAFAFETRNPAARAWEAWTAGSRRVFVADDGVPAWYAAEVTDPVRNGVVRFRSAYGRGDWPGPRHSSSVLRFLDGAALDERLARAGFAVAERYGDWERSPLDARSPEIVTIATTPAAGGGGAVTPLSPARRTNPGRATTPGA